MKYKGIIRRLDSLGRVVIPREYRKLHKVNEGDPLEIISLETGEIMVRKVDVSSQIVSGGSAFIDEIHLQSGFDVALCDNENFLCGAGSIASTYNGNQIPKCILNLIEERKNASGTAGEYGFFEHKHIFICPIFKQDSFGAMVVFSNEPIANEYIILTKSLCNILATNLQSY